MAIDFEIVNDPPADSVLWQNWKTLVDIEGWTSDDNSVTLLTPSLKSTRSVFAVNPIDKSFIGVVIWNEYDKVCFLGFFLLAPEYRGKGCGMTIWRAALNRMPKDYVLGLRGVPSMVEKYKAMSTPVVGAELVNYRMSSQKYEELFREYNSENYTAKGVESLTKEEWEKLLNYDHKINGRNRSEFLDLYYHHTNITKGLILLDDSQNIVAHISSVPTSRTEDKVLKIAPLYADTKEIALLALKNFSNVILENYPDFDVIFHILKSGRGDFLQRFFENLKFTPYVSGVTLYSETCPTFGDDSKVFIAHNNSCHYDY